MKKIYLAIPYTGIEDVSFEVANITAAKLMNKGYIIFSPISHSHHIAAEGGLEKGWDYWKRFDESFIEWCDEMWVIKLDGWKISKGVNAEICIAKELKKPVKFINP